MKQFFLLLFLILSLTNLYAQERIFSGTVIDENNDPLPGTTIMVKGASIGTITDGNGNFKILIPSGSKMISVSCIGYQTQDINIADKTTVNIHLVQNAIGLKEVVAVGYGIQKKATVTGAISTVKGSDLVKSPLPNLSSAVVGRVPGLLSIQRTGQPGNDETTLRIRGIGTLDNGNASPLVLVDGVERPFSQIEPNDIESISVLKDASSTAVYGIRGANGVILITTIRGKEGPAKVSYNGNFALQVPTRLPKFLDGYDFSRLQVEAQLNDNPTATPMFTPEELVKFQDGSDRLFYPSTDWFNLMMKKYAPQNQHNVNISGGTSIAKYYISLSYLNQGGLWKEFNSDYSNNDHFDRYNFRSNIDLNVSKTTKASISVAGYSSIRSTANGNIFSSILSAATNGTPGVWEGKVVTLARANGRNAVLATRGGFNKYVVNSMNLNFGLNQNFDFITKGLSARVKASYDSDYGQNRSFSKTSSIYAAERIDINGDGVLDPILRKAAEDGVLSDPSESFTRAKKIYMEAGLEYNRSFNDHQIGALLLYSQKKQWYHSLSYPGIPLGYQDLVTRFTYNYKQKYMFEFNMGRNGSENFPVKNRFGWFPAISAGWVATSEPFVKALIGENILSYMKLRVSYGTVGNDKMGTSRFMYYPGEYLSGGGAYFGEDAVSKTGYYEGKMGNPDVTWEKSYKQNYATELRFFKDKLSFNADVFFEDRSNILTARNTTPSHVAAVLQDAYNIGKVKNKGYELELGWNDKIGNVSYWLNGNYSFARNKIIFKDEALNVAYPYLNRTGRRVGEIFGYKFLGFFNNQKEIDEWPQQFAKNQRPGDVKYADINGDGIVDENDQTAIANPTFPEINYGFSGGFSWKGFDFSVLFQGTGNFSMSVGNEMLLPFSAYGSAMDYIKDRWYAGSPDNNANAKIPRLTLNYADMSNYFNSSLWIKDASYLRLRNLEFGYKFQNAAIKRVGISSLRLFLSGQNLFTWDKLKFLDPEGEASQSMKYPQLKVFNIGGSIQF
ncbi:MAG: TonB-dependent receptor [Bacteroidota bacterium]|nr:TonB-dependent receptor [Bacteroidota bacterium]MDP4225326.1 TonB-dependent receptor [Bacteroidota bacterium]